MHTGNAGNILYGSAGDEPGLPPVEAQAPGHYSADFSFHDARLVRSLRDGDAAASLIDGFFTCLSVCHTVIPDVNPADPSDIRLEAASPDEAALVLAADRFGYRFNNRTNTTVTSLVWEKPVTHTILNVNEFSSKRKRMSCVAEDAEKQKVLYIKGADNIMMPLLMQASAGQLQTLTQHLTECSNKGLRTLVLGRRKLSTAEYRDWNARYAVASTALDRREEKLEDVADLIEKDLELLGATAIEDRLQEGVYSPKRGPKDKAACTMAQTRYSGYWGPWLRVSGSP